MRYITIVPNPRFLRFQLYKVSITLLSSCYYVSETSDSLLFAKVGNIFYICKFVFIFLYSRVSFRKFFVRYISGIVFGVSSFVF